ncbi:MAG: metallophosphoesterase [Rhodopseudomonas palustris]|uniref:Metallophosphoesterase n=1 Tax=Rhodopseudomonas palustris TaxID=1076 RepID=A0A933S3S3_RHOPL|nr:metallophosphoesterase [Rhodopseudomonas palustris]
MSDLHVEFYGSAAMPRAVDGADFVIVAGDTCQGLSRAVETLRDAFPRTEVVTVPGNHEYYGRELPAELQAGRVRARQLGVHLLSDDAVTIGKARVLGATLWTDYCLFGHGLRELAMHTSRGAMRDHKRITWRRKPWARFRPEEAAALHLRSRNFLEAELAKVHPGPVIVASHHGMTLEAISPVNQRSLLSAAYASELLPLIDRHCPTAWISGHSHHPLNLRRNGTRLISNQRGYPGENTGFDPAFVMEIADD